MRVHRVYIIQVQKVVQNECFDRNENPKKLTQKWLVSFGNQYELVLEQNSFGYHVKGP